MKNMKPTSLVNPATSEFFVATKEKYVEFFRRIELTVHYATVDNISEIDAFFSSIYSPEIASEVSPYETFRAIKYGLIVILRDSLFSVIACQYLIPYNSDVRVSYAMRMAVRKDWEGKGIAINLYRLCTSEAMKYKCGRQDSLVDRKNIVMHNLLLNRVGAVYTDYITVKDSGIHDHFVSTVGLDHMQLYRDVDKKSFSNYIQHTSYLDYRIVDIDDIETINNLLNVNEYSIVAFVKPNWLKEISRYSFLFTMV